MSISIAIAIAILIFDVVRVGLILALRNAGVVRRLAKDSRSLSVFLRRLHEPSFDFL